VAKVTITLEDRDDNNLNFVVVCDPPMIRGGDHTAAQMLGALAAQYIEETVEDKYSATVIDVTGKSDGEAN